MDGASTAVFGMTASPIVLSHFVLLSPTQLPLLDILRHATANPPTPSPTRPTNGASKIAPTPTRSRLHRRMEFDVEKKSSGDGAEEEVESSAPQLARHS